MWRISALMSGRYQGRLPMQDGSSRSPLGLGKEAEPFLEPAFAMRLGERGDERRRRDEEHGIALADRRFSCADEPSLRRTLSTSVLRDKRRFEPAEGSS
jgi:hypothetical protein